MRILENLKITELIGRAPWREAVTYRDTWPHEYVLSRKDGQHELVELVIARFRAGEGVAGTFFGRPNTFLKDCKAGGERGGHLRGELDGSVEEGPGVGAERSGPQK